MVSEFLFYEPNCKSCMTLSLRRTLILLDHLRQIEIFSVNEVDASFFGMTSLISLRKLKFIFS